MSKSTKAMPEHNLTHTESSYKIGEQPIFFIAKINFYVILTSMVIAYGFKY